MKFSSYQPVVNPNTINPPAVQAPKDLEVYGTGGKEWTALAGAVGQATKVFAQKQDDEDAADVMDARNRIMTSLNEQLYGEQGLMTLGVGKNAKGLTDRVTQAIQDTSAEIAKDYNPRVRYALKSTLNDNMLNYQRIATGQENRERENTEQADYQAALNINTQNAGMTWDVTNALTNYENDTRRIILAYGAKRGWTGEQIQSELMGAITKQVASAATAAITAGNYDRAAQILQVNRGKMDQNVYNQLYGSVKQKQDVAKTYTTADDIVNQCWDPTTGRFDWNKADELIKQASYRNVGGQGASDKEAFFAAVEQQEDPNGDPNAVSSEGAVGIYQIMPGNWPAWSKEAGYEGADPNDEAAQRAVGRFKLGQYYDKYGPEGALVTWYAGEQNGQRWVAGEPDAIDENGNHYAWDKQLSNGPSIKEYVNSAMSNYHPKNAGSGSGTGGNPAGVTPVWMGTQGGNIDEQVQSLKPQWKDGVLGTIGGVLQQKFGVTGTISSAARTYEHQMEVNPGSPNSYHVIQGDGGDAVDIVLDGNLPDGVTTDDLLNYFKDSGKFKEVLFHDAGSGLHLHLGGYTGGWGTNGTGSAGGGSMVFDPAYYKTLYAAVNAGATDRTNHWNLDKQQHFESVERAVDTSTSYSGALQIIDGDTSLSLSDKLRLRGWAASKYNVNENTGLPVGSGRSGGGGSNSGSGGVTASKIETAYNTLENMNINLQNGNAIETASFTAARRAGNLLDDNGVLTDEQSSELRASYQSQDFMSSLTDDIETNGMGGAYNHLIQNGMDPLVATIIITKSDTHYLQKDYQGDQEEPEEG